MNFSSPGNFENEEAAKEVDFQNSEPQNLSIKSTAQANQVD